MKAVLRFLFLIIATACVFPSGGQVITPVESDDEKPEQPILHFYDKHGEPLDEPVLFLAQLDTVTKAKAGPVYPLLDAVSFGFNFFDAIMQIAGQKHQSFDVSAQLSLWNWIKPTLEFGVGFADNQPAGENFHYKGKASFYGKVGFDYNFLYKSNPDYQVFLGFRAAYANFKYDVTDITVNSSYWDQNQGFDILNQSGHAFYGQLVGGIKVKIYKAISMGWTARYGFKWSVKQPENSNVWFIPGYGTTGSLSATFSIYYTLPLGKKREVTPVAATPDIVDPLPERNIPATATPQTQEAATEPTIE